MAAEAFVLRGSNIHGTLHDVLLDAVNDPLHNQMMCISDEQGVVCCKLVQRCHICSGLQHQILCTHG